jgi:hypothetical protein
MELCRIATSQMINAILTQVTKPKVHYIYEDIIYKSILNGRSGGKVGHEKWIQL